MPDLNEKTFYPLKKYMGDKPVRLTDTGWFVHVKFRSLDVEKIEGYYSSRNGWVENYDGVAFIGGDLPGYVWTAYKKWLDEHTVLDTR